ncbi:MAG TPA: HNH endonuclease signature motif containing protein [Nitriliruptorales bacterium]
MPRPRTWTDADLRTAVAASTTYREVQRRLGLGSGSSHVAIRVRIAELGIDDQHLRDAARKRRTQRAHARRQREAAAARPRDRRTWSDDDLRAAVASATNLNGVFKELGLSVGGDQWLTMQDHVRRLGLDTTHWKRPLPATAPSRARSWTDDDLVEAVKGARSYAEVCRRLDVRGGGGHATVKARIEQLGLDTRHLRGQAWARGETNPAGRARRPLDEILVVDSTHRDTNRLKRRLIEEGMLEPRCSRCGITEWNGEPAPLQLDHINGDRRDNRRGNLRILCANCHAQTSTFGARNRGRYALAPEEAG